MGHLWSFRKGWQSEHLAKYILSKFNFIAHPDNISDDIGSDLFCTIFKVEKGIFLLPQSTYAIQIKSNADDLDFSNKTSYLQNLEIPFFVGVINKNAQSLTIYSGESVDHFFTLYGNPSLKNRNNITTIRLIEKRDPNKIVFNDKQEFVLYFPKIFEIRSDFDYEKERIAIDDFLNLIRLIQRNISSRISKEYILETPFEDGLTYIYAGPGSAKTYKENLYTDLSEIKLQNRINPLLRLL